MFDHATTRHATPTCVGVYHVYFTCASRAPSTVVRFVCRALMGVLHADGGAIRRHHSPSPDAGCER